MHKISVCMITHNGEKFIVKQVESILSQLREGDELVVSDDNSSDGTLAALGSFRDSRLKVKTNSRGSGVIKNLENCLLSAVNDIIFLSDQDDVWFSNKVSAVLSCFNDPKISLVISDAQIIDAQGNIMADSFFARRGKFRPGALSNIVKNKYIGCAMAFRKELLSYVLPFPKNIPMHDMWIGIVNDIYGKTFYINGPLMQYRRHGNNTNRLLRSPVPAMINGRVALIRNILALLLKHGFKKIPR